MRQRRAGLEQSRRYAKEIRSLSICQHDDIVGIDDDNAFLRTLKRVGEPRLRAAALLDFTVHHRLDVVAHHSHRGEQRTEFIGAAARHRDVEFAGGDTLGHAGSNGNRSDDAASESPSHCAGQKQRQHRSGDIKLHVVRHGAARVLPIEKSVAGGVVHQ